MHMKSTAIQDCLGSQTQDLIIPEGNLQKTGERMDAVVDPQNTADERCVVMYHIWLVVDLPILKNI